jgi:hypothetical protein
MHACTVLRKCFHPKKGKGGYFLFCPLPLPYPRSGPHGVGFLPILLPPAIPSPRPLPSLGLFCPLGFLSLIFSTSLLFFCFQKSFSVHPKKGLNEKATIFTEFIVACMHCGQSQQLECASFSGQILRPSLCLPILFPREVSRGFLLCSLPLHAEPNTTSLISSPQNLSNGGLISFALNNATIARALFSC